MKIVHVIGTGTIGEPLIGMLSRAKDVLGFDQVTFNKRTPLLTDRSKVVQLIETGALLATDNKSGFVDMGIEPSFTSEEAIDRATVIIDCTPGGIGLENKEKFYYRNTTTRMFIAQGSEDGFGKKYAFGINDEVLQGQDWYQERFHQIVSCNTHNLAALVQTIGMDGGHDPTGFVSADFTFIRRTNDISQTSSFSPALSVGAHSSSFGTHHAKDLHAIMSTKGIHLGTEDEPTVFSSACKIPSQYMHGIRFRIETTGTTLDLVRQQISENEMMAVTHKSDSNKVFSFGRDYGLYGRILNQTVINLESLSVQNDSIVTGFCFTPQDGNSLISSVAAATYGINPKGYQDRVKKAFGKYLFSEV